MKWYAVCGLWWLVALSIMFSRLNLCWRTSFLFMAEYFTEWVYHVCLISHQGMDSTPELASLKFKLNLRFYRSLRHDCRAWLSHGIGRDGDKCSMVLTDLFHGEIKQLKCFLVKQNVTGPIWKTCVFTLPFPEWFAEQLHYLSQSLPSGDTDSWARCRRDGSGQGRALVTEGWGPGLWQSPWGLWC